jgi:hypothetical protein
MLFEKDDSWRYKANESEWEMVVPLANGEVEEIEHIAVT